ncbi:MAG TPA: ATP-binding cassette domain-containing protein [Acidimicrobiia bacterium]|nr:ATP-binding cassette domain-containing protein [Acidimicrobiia bacterium]
MGNTSDSSSRKSPLLFADRLKQSFIINAVAALGTAAIHIAFAICIAKFIPDVLEGNVRSAQHLVYAICILGTLKALLSFFTEYFNARTFRIFHAGLVRDIMSSRHAISNNKKASSPIAHVLTSGIDQLENYVRIYVPAFAGALVIPAACVFAIAYTDAVSALIVCATVPLVPLFMILIGKHTRDITRSQWDGLRDLSNSFAYIVEGITTLRMYGQHNRVGTYIERVSQRYRRSIMRTLKVAFLSAFALEAIATLSVALVAVTLGARLVEGQVSFHDALLVLFVIPECYWPLRKLGSAYHSSEVGKDAAHDIHEILSTSVSGPFRDVDRNNISWKHLSVDRGDNSAIALGSGHCQIGETTVITGQNGTGKSSLLNALMNRIPSHGHINIGDTSLSNIDPENWKSQFAYMHQDGTVYPGNVKEAIAFTDQPDKCFDDIVRHLDIKELIYSTTDQLSGGQRQRVALAHAVYKLYTSDAWLLLADEPSAHLDHENTRRVVELLNEVAAKGYCVIVTSHDSTIIQSSDHNIQLSDPLLTPLSLTRLQSDVENIVHESSTVSKVSSRESIGLFSSVARQVIGRTVTAITMATLVDIASICLAATSLWLIVRAGQRPLFSELVFASLCVRIFGISKACGRYVERLTTHRGALEIVTRLRVSTAIHLTSIMPGSFPEAHTGTALHRVIDDHDAAQDLFIRSIVPVLSTAIAGMIAAGALFFVNTTSGMIASICVVVCAVLIPLIGAMSHSRNARISGRSAEEYSRQIYDYSSSIDLITTSRDFDFARGRVAQPLASRHNAMMENARVNSFLSSMTSGMGYFSVAAIVFFVGTSSTHSAPVTAIALLGSFSIMGLFENNVRSGEYFHLGMYAWGRIKEIHNRKPAFEEPINKHSVSAQSIELKELSILWPNGHGCRNVTAKVNNHSRHIALVGPSGSGKSTLAAGLVRFLDITSGSYVIDGNNASEYDSNEVRKSLIWLTQDPWLSPGTLKDNMLMANPEVTDNEIYSVLLSIDAHNLVDEHPDGVNRIVQVGGNNFSRGEQSKIALARMLLSSHKIKIFDEPEASLDSKSITAFNRTLSQQSDKIMSIYLSHDRPAEYDQSNVEFLEVQH